MPHSHRHTHAASSQALGLAFFLNLGFAIVELVGGLWTGSFAILADALHDFGDSLAVGLAWFLHRYSKRGPSRSFTYGYRRFTLLGAFVAGAIVIAGSFGIFASAIHRLLQAPQAPLAVPMLWLAVLGITVNVFAAWRMHSKDVTTQILRLHFFEDAASWIVVLVGAVVIHYTAWTWVDPVLAMGLSVWIAWNAGKALRDGFTVLLQGAPTQFDQDKFVSKVCSIPGVMAVHDVHAWSLDGDQDVVSAHVVVSKSVEDLFEIKCRIRDVVGRAHLTVELEREGEPCHVSCESHSS